MFHNTIAFHTLKAFASVFAGTLGLFFALGFGVVIMGMTIGGLSSLVSEDSLDSIDATYVFHAGDATSRQKLLSIPIEGVILGEPSENDWTAWLSGDGVTYGYSIKEELMTAAAKDEVDGVILEFHSPGGTIFGSQAIADGVAEYRQATGKPVYAFVGSMAASGAYWAAAATDKIYADAGTSIGSIGVIYGPFKYYDGVISEDGGAFMGGVVTQNGIESQYITAGTSKDLGNPYRRLTESEVTVLQADVDNAYDQFVNFVAANRKLSAFTIRSAIGALIYDESQAQTLGLIDATANRDEVYQELAQAANLDSYQVVRSSQDSSFWSQLMMSLTRPETPRTTTRFCPFATNVLALAGASTQWCQ